MTLAGDLVVAEEADGERREECQNQAGEGENAEENISRQERDVEGRKINEGQIFGKRGLFPVSFHVGHPIGEIESEESGGRKCRQNDGVPHGGETVSIFSQPPEEGGDEENGRRGDAVVPFFRNHHRRGKAGRRDSTGDDGVCHKRPERQAVFGVHVAIDARQEFGHKETEEERERRERIHEEQQDDEHGQERQFPSFENKKIAVADAMVLRVHRETHENEIGHHDADYLYGAPAQIEERGQDENRRIRAGEARDNAGKETDIQESNDCTDKIQNSISFLICDKKFLPRFCDVDIVYKYCGATARGKWSREYRFASVSHRD